MARTFGKLISLAVACCGAASFLGCSSNGGDAASTPDSADAESLGKVGLALQLASGATIDSASYTMTGPGGFASAASDGVSIQHSEAPRLTFREGGDD